MEIEQLKSSWKVYEQKLTLNWELSMHLLREHHVDKAQRKMNQLTWVIGITLAFYLLAGIFFAYFTLSNWPLAHLVATGAVFTLWTLAIAMASIHELELIRRIDYTAPVVEVQRRLSELKLVIIRYLRLGVWIFPFYFGFIILFFKLLFGVDIVAHADQNWLIWNGVISVVIFLPFAIWAHRKLSARNMHRKWMENLLQGNGSQITSAIGFLQEIERFEKEGEH